MSSSSRRRSTAQSSSAASSATATQEPQHSKSSSAAATPTGVSGSDQSDGWASGGSAGGGEAAADADATFSYLNETGNVADAATIALEEAAGAALGGWHYAPLLIALAPAMASLLGGRADAWSDAILLLLASFWLYQFLKIPHEIYRAARSRRVLHVEAVDAEMSPERKAQSEAAAAELRRAEVTALISCMLSPIAGAWVLSWLMDNLTDGNRYLNSFNIRLFMLAAGIKPWSHAFSLLRRHLLHLHEVVNYPSSRVEILNRRVSGIESELSQLRRLVALKKDVSLLRDGIDVPLTQLSRNMRRFEKKEEHLRLSAEDKFNLMESRLEDLLREVAINAELIEEERRERERVSSLPSSIYHAVKFALGSRESESQHKRYLYDAPRHLPSTASLGITGPDGVSGAGSPQYGKSSLSGSNPPSYGHGSPPRYGQTGVQSPPQQAHSSLSQYPADKDAGSRWYSHGPAWILFGLPNAALRFASDKVRGAVSDATAFPYQQPQVGTPGAHAGGAQNVASRSAKMHSASQQRRLA